MRRKRALKITGYDIQLPGSSDDMPGILLLSNRGGYYNESIRARGPEGPYFTRRKNVKNELVIVLDFGGQYNQLVARRVRNVMCTVRFILTKQILRRSKL